MKKIIEFVLKYKNGITTAWGAIIGLAMLLKPMFENSTPDIWTVIQAVGVYLIGYFTGKSPK